MDVLGELDSGLQRKLLAISYKLKSLSISVRGPAL